MTIDERYKYLRRMKTRYLKADRKERGRLLDEMEAVTGLRRRSLIWLLKGALARQPRARQRSKTYKEDVTMLACGPNGDNWGREISGFPSVMYLHRRHLVCTISS